MSLDYFHPAVASWFLKQFTSPTESQSQAWPSIREQRPTLIAAPTGSGKTLAAFLAAIDGLVRQGCEGTLSDTTQVLYVSPLKALSNDIQRNLQFPLEGIQRELQSLSHDPIQIRTLVRTGDTPASERTAVLRRPPHIVVTTPESLYILLTSEGGRKILQTVRTVIVDEIHALVGSKRGSHLALSLERLKALVGENLVRIGLSATQRPIEEVARFLVGRAGIDSAGKPDCTIIDTGHFRAIDIAIEIPNSPLDAVMSGEVWQEIYTRLASLILEHRSTLVFVNTRRLAERVARHLGERIGEDHVTAHHGSLARQQRFNAEQRLKQGNLRALVATASLELGIDIGAVDLVCQIGSTRSISTLLQRVGRSGHSVGGFPKGRIFPLSRDELVESAALLDCIRRRELDRLVIPEQPLDILAQQIVAAVACQEWQEDALYELVHNAYPYRNLARKDFDAVVQMLSEGFSTRMGRRSAYLHRDGIHHQLRPRRGARLAAITSGGAIPDTADYDVVLEPTGTVIGSVNEDFAIESMAGDIFQLGNASWRIQRVEPGKVRVEDAKGQPPSIPFWLGEAPARTAELSAAVSRLRTEVANRLDSGGDEAAQAWLIQEVGMALPVAEQIVQYLATAKAALGVMPSQQTLVIERFFDESGGMQLVIHSPFGSRVNRAWGLALRKRFCRKFNFELQAAATEEAIVLSLSHAHSFPLNEVFRYLRSDSICDLLTQALLDAPMFVIRWRWNASRALAVLRWRGGKKVAPQLQRMNAEDLLAAVFPDQVACAENISGDREIPDHPLVTQTLQDCLEEGMDLRAFQALLVSIEKGEKRLVACDLNGPSPLAAEILNARPYAFLDDAPLEERRTQAVYSRRWLTPESAADMGALDPAAIQRVCEEAWPEAENPDELHDALMQLGYMTEAEGKSGSSNWESYFQSLIADQRAMVIRFSDKGHDLWIAAERLKEFRASATNSVLITGGTPLKSPLGKGGLEGGYGNLRSQPGVASEDALVEILRGRLEGVGPTTSAALAASAGIPLSAAEIALAKLEAEGFVLRGRFTAGVSETEWCVRHLLARIHRYTLEQLRREIEPVSSADFIRFLLAWQGVSPDHRLEGQESLARVLEQLEGFEAPASAWEGEILPARLVEYDPAWLDHLCLSGRWVWARLRPPKSDPLKVNSTGPIRSTPIALLNRQNASVWSQLYSTTAVEGIHLSLAAQAVWRHLLKSGASFFSDLVNGTGLLRTQIEVGIGELVAWGLVNADSFMGLRALLTPSNKRPPLSSGIRKRSVAPFGMDNAGRWSLLHRTPPNKELSGEGSNPVTAGQGSLPNPESVETIARVLLRRYGVIFRRLMEREGIALPWRDLLRVYRRLEARGEIRGGRFVDGFTGEQFALPEAVGMLRSIRRSPSSGRLVSVSAADPLNLVGVLTPGERILPVSANRVLYRDGVPVAFREARQVHFLIQLEPVLEWEARNALVRRSFPPQLRAYLGQPA